MNTKPPNRMPGADEADDASRGLAALSSVHFDQLEPAEILDAAATAVDTLAAPCRVEASYRNVAGQMVPSPRSQPRHPDIENQLHESAFDGRVEVSGRKWGWAFALRHQNNVKGCLVVSAGQPPGRHHYLLLTIFAQQTGAALGYAEMHHSDVGWAHRLEDANRTLAAAVHNLRAHTDVHEVLGAAVAAGLGEHGIADALHELTGLSVAIEDRFGNLRIWGGPGRPQSYPKPSPESRELLLHQLASPAGVVRIADRLAILIKPRADILGVLALIDPDQQATDNHMFALQYGGTVLGAELSHQRNLAEMELNLRRELVDDLLAGADEQGAYVRAEALRHDLHRPHYVVVVHHAGGANGTVVTAVGRAATALHLNHLQVRHGPLVVLLADDRPEPRALHRELSRALGSSASVVGIGSRCDRPSDFPASFAKAQRALNIRLHSAAPAGASAYDELGFYRLIDAAHSAGAVEDFVREWLGALLDYDENKNADLVHTLSNYLECGGNYDESAATLHIHRSTLRYRLGRIAELTGYDVRDVDTRFNLHAATRAWRFLNPIS
jgi:PucR C-terminal helix-turn-helix domain/GGDEF-like domain